MANPWRLSDEDRLAVKTTTDLSVEAAGGQENCAEVSGRVKRAAAYSDYRNPAIRDRVVPLDVAAELDRFNLRRGHPAHHLMHLARLCGFELVPRARPASAQMSMSAVVHVVKESHEAVDAFIAAEAAGPVLSREQRRAFLQEIDQGIEAFLIARDRVLQHGEGE